MGRDLEYWLTNHDIPDNRKNNIGDCSGLDMIMVDSSELTDGVLLISIYFSKNIDNTISEYIDKNDTIEPEFYDVLGFGEIYKYIFRSVFNSTEHSRDTITHMLTNSSIMNDVNHRFHINLYIQEEKII